MKPILYESTETEFTTNGIGRMSDAISCNVREAINGQYELEMVYPISGIHFSDLEEHKIIYSSHDETGEPEPFEIYRISKPINGKVTVNATHISYRLNKCIVLPFTASGVQTALAGLKSHSATTIPFEFTSDKTTSGEMKVEVPTSIRSQMGGIQGSIIDIYGGEWEFTGFRCTLRNRRGLDTDVNIRYGKNLTNVTKTTDSTNLWTGVIPYWRGMVDNEEVTVHYNGIIWSSVRNNFPYDMIIPADASSVFESAPTQSQLEDYGRQYVTSNARSSVPMSVKVSFVQLWQTEEYKDVAPLQRLRIGDSVHVFYDALGVNNTARIVECDYNVLLERYDSMTIGEVSSNLATSVSSSISNATKDLPTKSFFELALERATDKITGGTGGYVVINRNAAGEPNEILVMNTNDKTTATRVLRINYQGIAMGTGYNGPFNSAWLAMDGTFDAENINVVNINAASIVAGILRSANGRAYFDLDNNEISATKLTNNSLWPYGNITIDTEVPSDSSWSTEGFVKIYNSMAENSGVVRIKPGTSSHSKGCISAADGLILRYGTVFYNSTASSEQVPYISILQDSITLDMGTNQNKKLSINQYGVDAGANLSCINFSMTGTFTYKGSPVVPSDRNLKKNIKPITQKYIDAIGSVELQEYEYKDEDGIRFGAVAQDVIESFEKEGLDWKESSIVKISRLRPEDDEFHGLNYMEFIVIRLAYDEQIIKQQQDKIQDLESRVERLEKLIERMASK